MSIVGRKRSKLAVSFIVIITSIHFMVHWYFWEQKIFEYLYLSPLFCSYMNIDKKWVESVFIIIFYPNICICNISPLKVWKISNYSYGKGGSPSSCLLSTKKGWIYLDAKKSTLLRAQELRDIISISYEVINSY